MFRIGSALFIPAYLTVTLYRPFASENDDGSVVLMAGECVTLRWGLTWAYRAPISPFTQHVSFPDPYFSSHSIHHGSAGQVRSDIAEQLSHTPRSPFSLITVWG